MKKMLWNGVASVLGVAAAVLVRQAAARLWPGSNQPPLNPADRRIGWQQALAWAIVAGGSAGIARMMSRRFAASGWEAAFDEAPPGISVS